MSFGRNTSVRRLRIRIRFPWLHDQRRGDGRDLMMMMMMMMRKKGAMLFPQL